MTVWAEDGAANPSERTRAPAAVGVVGCAPAAVDVDAVRAGSTLNSPRAKARGFPRHGTAELGCLPDSDPSRRRRR